MSKFNQMKKQTKGIAKYNYSNNDDRIKALTNQYGHIRNNVKSGDITEKQANELFRILRAK